MVLSLGSVSDFISYCQRTTIDDVLSTDELVGFNEARITTVTGFRDLQYWPTQYNYLDGVVRNTVHNLAGLVFAILTHLVSGVSAFCGSVDAATRTYTLYEFLADRQIPLGFHNLNIVDMYNHLGVNMLTVEGTNRAAMVFRMILYKINRLDMYQQLRLLYPNLPVMTWDLDDMSSLSKDHLYFRLTGFNGISDNTDNLQRNEAIWNNYNALQPINPMSVTNSGDSGNRRELLLHRYNITNDLVALRIRPPFIL